MSYEKNYKYDIYSELSELFENHNLRRTPCDNSSQIGYVTNNVQTAKIANEVQNLKDPRFLGIEFYGSNQFRNRKFMTRWTFCGSGFRLKCLELIFFKIEFFQFSLRESEI